MNLLLFCSLLLNLVTIPATKTPASHPILIADTSIAGRKWAMQEIRFLYDNVPYYYKRDDYAKSNMNFDNDNIIFNCDGTGIYHQTNDVDYPLKWHYIEPGKNVIQFTISKFRNNCDLLVTWENIELSNNTIKYTEYYTHKGGMNCLGYGIRTTNDTIP